MPVQITQQVAFGQNYVDINALYNIDAQPELIQGVAAVQNSLFNLFSTIIRTVPYLRAFGTTLMTYVYEPYDAITANDALFSLYQAIGQWEPRVIVDKKKSSITGIPGNPYGYLVTMVCILVSNSQPFTYQFQATPLT